MAYGDLKCNNLIYETGSGDVTIAINTIPSTAGATFTGDVTLTGAANNVVWDVSDNALEFADDAKLSIGSGADLQIYHSSNESKITNQTGSIWLQSDTGIRFTDHGLNQSMAAFYDNGACELYHNGTKKIETTAAGVTVSGSVTDDKGNVRDIPYSGNSGAYTLVAADAGKVLGGDTSWTIPASIFSAGNTVTLLNLGGSALGITASALTTLYNTADGANIKASTITLGARGMATIWFASDSSAYIQSAALTVS